MFISTQKTPDDVTMFLYQSLCCFYDPAPISKDFKDTSLVDGITIKIDHIHAYTQNIITREESFNVFKDQFLAYKNNTPVSQPTYDWSLCFQCAMYFSFFMKDFMPLMISNEDLIAKQVLIDLYSQFQNKLEETYNSNTYEKVICSYGNCYGSILTELDPYNAPAEKRDHRMLMLKYYIDKYKYTKDLNKQTRITFRQTVLSECHNLPLSQEEQQRINQYSFNNLNNRLINHIFSNS